MNTRKYPFRQDLYFVLSMPIKVITLLAEIVQLLEQHRRFFLHFVLSVPIEVIKLCKEIEKTKIALSPTCKRRRT